MITLYDDTADQIATLNQAVQQLMQEVGAADYLNLLRSMDEMRGNATRIMQMLSNPDIRAQLKDPNSTYHSEYAAADLRLSTDIIALLDPDQGFFRRAYYEQLIRGDGNWEAIIPDRPVDQNGTTFEHRLGMPTVAYLVSARLASMFFLNPDFVSSGINSVEIDHWWRRIQQLSDEMGSYVRQTAVMPIDQQCSRRQEAGQELFKYYDWQTHCYVAPPNSLSPIGAIDITTGFGTINWDYTQFDEWYLRQGDLHGRDAGYWPPSIGPQYYEPPPYATGLPPMNEATIQAYYRMAQYDPNGAVDTARTVMDQIGVTAASQFAWQMFDFAYPGVGTP